MDLNCLKMNLSFLKNVPLFNFNSLPLTFLSIVNYEVASVALLPSGMFTFVRSEFVTTINLINGQFIV